MKGTCSPYRALGEASQGGGEVAVDPASVFINPIHFSSCLEGSEGDEGRD